MAYTEKLLHCKLSSEQKSHPNASLGEEPEEPKEPSMLFPVSKCLKKFYINGF